MNDDPFIPKLAAEVERIKNNEEWRLKYMSMVQQALGQCIRWEVKLEAALKFIENGYPIDQLASILDLSKKQLKK